MQPFEPSATTQQRILCCQCGTVIAPNQANMCMQCLQGRVDITEGITKQITMPFCRNCERFLCPPNQWMVCAPESKELLSLCLKRVKGLNRVRLIDAGFIWTEPHSRRLKVKLTIQKEVMATAILQQAFVVDAVLANQHCEDCDKVMAQNTWKAVVQLRQKVNHKRTFLYLEQLILKHNMHKDATNIKDLRDGLDFFFGSKNQAIRLLDFLASVVPIRYKTSEQLISSDIHSGSANYKFTFSVEIVPICKDDLVCLPPRIAAATLGASGSSILLCSKVSNIIQFVDPNTLQIGDLSNNDYWRQPFRSLCTSQDLAEYYVLDIEQSTRDTKNNYKSTKYSLVDVHVAKMSDFGKNDTTFIARSHLGNILKVGDLVYGYDLRTANFNNDDFALLQERHGSVAIPDVVLVKKSYSDKRRTNRGRSWKLKNLKKTVDDEDENGVVKSSASSRNKQDIVRMEEDYEYFLRDLEEDEEMRAGVNLYKDPEAIDRRHSAANRGEECIIEDVDDADDEDAQVPEVPIEELLDELNLMSEDEQ